MTNAKYDIREQVLAVVDAVQGEATITGILPRGDELSYQIRFKPDGELHIVPESALTATSAPAWTMEVAMPGLVIEACEAHAQRLRKNASLRSNGGPGRAAHRAYLRSRAATLDEVAASLRAQLKGSEV